MILLLVGPSGVGKTTLSKYAADSIPATEFYDLDDLVARANNAGAASEVASRVGWEQFFDLCQLEVEKIEKKDDARIHIIAVGAGTLMSTKTLAWLKDYITVTIFASPEVVRPRNPLGPNRNVEEFIQTEYSPYRQQIYTQSQHTLDVSTLGIREAKEAFVQLIKNDILELTK